MVTVPTVPVYIAAALCTNTALPNAMVQLQLTAYDIVAGSSGAQIAPEVLTVNLAADGTATVQLFPNAMGTRGTQYKVTVIDQYSVVQFSGLATIPNYACNLHDVLNLAPPVPIDQATQAVNLARDWAVKTGSAVADGEFSAKYHAQAAKTDRNQADLDAAATAADRLQTAADRVQTGLDRTQTGLDKVAADASAAQASAFSLTAIAQAALASLMAIAASSAVAQDISGVTAAALHRSPNPVVGFCISDPSKDSDPSWPQRTAGLPYATQRTLNGAWLTNGTAANGILNELHARMIGSTVAAETNADADFDTGSGWTGTGTGATISGGLLTLNSPAAAVVNTAPCVNATIYRVTIVVTSYTSGTINWQVGGTAGTGITGPGTYVYYVTASGTNAARIQNTGAPVASITTFSVKAVTAVNTSAGAYFQNSVDGKCYVLNGSYTLGGALPGVTETFDGNYGPHPQGRVAWVAEGLRVIGYAIDLPGRPMWMVFTNTWTGPTAAANILTALAGNLVTDVKGREGELVIAANNNTNLPVVRINFAKNTALGYSGSAAYGYKGGIESRNSALGFASLPNVAASVSGATPNSIAMCTLPDAPVDPVTGLQVPTIAVFHNAGIGVIQNDGTVVASASTSNYKAGTITPYLLTANNASTSAFAYAIAPGKLGASWTINLAGTTPPSFGGQFTNATVQGRRGMVAQFVNNSDELQWIRLNEMAFGASVHGRIRSNYNTGPMLGTVVRAYSETVSGALSDAEGVLNGNFADASVWTTNGGWTISGGTANQVSQVDLTQPCQFTLAVGDIIRVTWTTTALTSGFVYPFVGGSTQGAAQVTGGSSGRSGTGTFSVDVQITTLVNQNVGLTVGNSPSGISVDNVSVKRIVVIDRSYKAGKLLVNGTGLVKAPVAAGAQVQGISGFSATSFLREGYSADLDTGTGSVMVSQPVILPAVGTAGIIMERSAATGAYWRLGWDATGKLYVEMNDATNPARIATSTASYASMTVRVALEYSTSGTLSLRVGKEIVAQTTGAPLLTMNNASAVLTVGNNFAGTAPFPGSIVMLGKIGATVPTQDAADWMHAQEMAMMQPGAQVTLPDAGALTDLTYDPETDRWVTTSAANEAQFQGCVRVSATPVAAGSISKVAAASGVKLVGRITTNPGVDVTVTPQLLGPELARARGQGLAAVGMRPETFEWLTGLPGVLAAANSALVTSVVPTIPAGATLVGAQFTASGQFTGTRTVNGYTASNTTLQVDATAAGSGAINISYLDYILPLGWEPKVVMKKANAGTSVDRLREGATADYTVLFDGFRYRVRLATAPASNDRLFIDARRYA